MIKYYLVLEFPLTSLIHPMDASSTYFPFVPLSHLSSGSTCICADLLDVSCIPRRHSLRIVQGHIFSFSLSLSLSLSHRNLPTIRSMHRYPSTSNNHTGFSTHLSCNPNFVRINVLCKIMSSRVKIDLELSP